MVTGPSLVEFHQYSKKLQSLFFDKNHCLTLISWSAEGLENQIH